MTQHLSGHCAGLVSVILKTNCCGIGHKLLFQFHCPTSVIIFLCIIFLAYPIQTYLCKTTDINELMFMFFGFFFYKSGFEKSFHKYIEMSAVTFLGSEKRITSKVRLKENGRAVIRMSTHTRRNTWYAQLVSAVRPLERTICFLKFTSS